jgi:hypothetical protein
MTPGKNRALIAPRKHEKSQGHYHHGYMVTRAILAKVCRCKPNRHSLRYTDFKQGSKFLKVNYFPSSCIGVEFSTSRCRTRSVTKRFLVGRGRASPFTFALLENSPSTKRPSSRLLARHFGTLASAQRSKKPEKVSAGLLCFGRLPRRLCHNYRARERAFRTNSDTKTA